MGLRIFIWEFPKKNISALLQPGYVYPIFQKWLVKLHSQLIGTLCFLFFPWKPKVCVKAIFGTFCHFFHGCKIIFTHVFLTFFTGSPGFSRTRSTIFSRGWFFFSRAEKWKISRVGILFSRTEIGLSPMVAGDLDFILSWVGTLILKYYQLVQDAVFRVGFWLFLILYSTRWKNFEITLESWPLLEGDFGFNLS